MKRSLTAAVFFILFLSAQLVFAQTAGDFRSFVTGNWSNVNTWERFDGATWINPAPNAPTSADGVITLLNGHTITDGAGVTADQIIINNGGTLTVNGVTFTVAAGPGDDLVVNSGGVVSIIGGGTLQIQNIVAPPPPRVALVRVFGTLNNTGTVSNASPSTIIFEANSIYDHRHTTLQGAIPSASWDNTSTCLVSGYTSNTATPAGLGQNFGNFTWDTPAMTGFIDLKGGLTTVNGNLIFRNIPSSYVYLTSITNYTLTVGGDFTVSNSFLGFNSSATATINVIGNTLFSSNGDLNPTFSGNTTLNLTGNLEFSGGTTNMTYGGSANLPINVGGNLTLSSSPAINNGGSGAYTLTFNGSGTQNYVAAQAFTDYDFVIANGSSVNVADGNFFSGAGAFTLQAGGTIGVGSVSGLVIGTSTGNVRVAGARNFTANGNIVYNGSAAQSLGDEWSPTGAINGIAVNLEIDNTNGVTNDIIGATSLVGDLILTNGPLNIGNNNSLDVQNDFIVTSGTIGGYSTGTSNLTFSGSGTMGTLMMAPGAQDLNNLTVTRAGDLVLGSALTVGGILDLTGNLDFSGQSLVLNGSMSGAGGLKSNATSDLTIGGTGAFGAVTYAGSGNQLNNLTLNRTSGGTYTWDATVTINSAVNLNFGALTHSSGLTMAANSTIIRDQGSILSNAPNAVSSYNVTYTGAGSTGLELPVSTTALNNLTTNVSGIVSLQNPVTVNGDFVLASGTFDATTNNLTMAGANWTGDGGTYTINSGNTTIFAGATVMGGSSPGGTQFGNLTINGGASLTAPPANINVSGVWSSSGTFAANGGTVTFNGAGQTLNSSGTIFNNVVVSSGTVTLGDAMDVNGDLTISSTLNVGAGNNSINLAGAWLNNGTFTHGTGTVIFDGANQTITSSAKPFFNVTLGGSGIALLGDALDLNGALTINNGAGLSTGVSNYDITLDGNWTNNGSFAANSGKVTFTGTNVQNISGSTITAFNDIDDGNTSTFGVSIESDQNLTGTLTLTSASAKFDADGLANSSVFTLVSSDDNPATDGNIAALPTPANFLGNVTVQRYMSGEGRIWRYLAAPVSGLLVSDWQTQFPITGNFTGADDLGGLNNPSLYDYIESTLGVLGNGWRAYPLNANTESIVPGTGYSAFIRNATGPTIVSQTGPINAGNFAFTVGFTANQGAADDGWNLLGNPYPSALDWDLLWADAGTANINSTIYIKDNGGGGGAFATYNAATGTGTNPNPGNGQNGGTKNIAQGQGFWVHANAASPSLTATESMKTTDAHDFFRTAPPADYMRITLSDGTYRDETLVHFFEDASSGLDKYDAYKLDNDIFNLSSLLDDGSDMVIQALKTFACSSNLNLNISNIEPGTYTLNFTELESFNKPIEMFLQDKFTGENVLITNEYMHNFEVTGDANSFGADRFSLSFNSPAIDTELLVKGSEVCESQSAIVTIESTEPGVTYTLTYNGAVVSEPAVGNGSAIDLAVINIENMDGAYEITAVGDDGCGSMMLTTKAIVVVDGIQEIETVQDAQSCTNASLTLSATGALETGNYRWYETVDAVDPVAESTDGQFTTPELTSSTTYFVAVINSVGCEGTRVEVEAKILNLEIPTIAIDTIEFRVYRLTSSYTTGNQWYANGELIAGETGQTLIITDPGVYEVLVEQDGCMVISEEFDGMDLITAIEQNNIDIIQVFPNPVSATIHVYLDQTDAKTLEVVITDINGKTAYRGEVQRTGSGFNFDLYVNDYRNGVYFVRMSDGEKVFMGKFIKE